MSVELSMKARHNLLTPKKTLGRAHSKERRPVDQAPFARTLRGIGIRRCARKMGDLVCMCRSARISAARVATIRDTGLARLIGLPQQLGDSIYLKRKSLRSLIGESEKSHAGRVDQWARDFDSWDVVDFCRVLFCYLYACKACMEQGSAWSRHREESVRERAAFPD